MKPRFSTLGRQLNSVAQRYRQPLVKSRGPQQLRPRATIQQGLADGSLKDLAEQKLTQLETVLFLAREPLSTRKLAKLAKLADGTEARTLTKQLASRYDQRGRALQVVEVAGGFQLLTRPQLAPWIGRLHGDSQEVRLSAPALETLAVVAYRQPVVRAEIEAIRGVQCGEILRVLMERDLLRIVGRADELGRPFLYGTTKRFLQVFGLRRLDQLPVIDQIHSEAS
ncbi:MAG: SMC-Scp complex subunit ScpB [Planctomycetota bacterium]